MPDGRLARSARFVLQLAVALGILLGVEALAHLPLGQPPAGAAIRLAIRTAAGKIEICRDVPPEELARLPVHMRQPRLCEEQPVIYRLTLRVDGAVVHSVRAERRGMRGDRPLVIDDLVAVAAGRRTLVVTLEPEVPEGTAPAAAGALPRGELARTVDLPAGRIALVTWEAAAGLAIRQ
jgi:hypothetical protein